MITLFLYDDDRRTYTIHELEGEAQMPHVDRLRFPVSDFCRGARTAVCWTTRAALRSLDRFAARSRVPFFVRGGFRRIESGAFPFGAPQHAGYAFHCRAAVPEHAARLALEAQRAGVFPCTVPPYTSSNDVRVYFPCRTRFEAMRAGTDVLALQDALLTIGFSSVALTGQFDAATQRALRTLRLLAGLPASQAVGSNELREIHRLTSAYQRAKMRGNHRLCMDIAHWHKGEDT